MRPEIDLAGIVEFVGKRRKNTGGYGATPRLPATIEDTYGVLSISLNLARLNPEAILETPPQEDRELQAYLMEALARPWPGLRTTAQLIRACRQLGLPPVREKGRAYLVKNRSTTPDFRTACYCAAIADELELVDYRDPTWAEVGLPERQTVRDVLMYLELRQRLGHDPAGEHGKLVAWLQRCQNGDGGFGFFPGTTSFIENCHYGIAALRLLGVKPADPENARRFLISCQTGSGGLGRNPRAASFLDATWHGLAALCCLPE